MASSALILTTFLFSDVPLTISRSRRSQLCRALFFSASYV